MFIANLKERVVHSLNIKDAAYLNNQLKWTVLEDKDILEDADLQTSNKVFTDWLSGEGQTELAHVPDKPVSPSGDPFRAFPSSPRCVIRDAGYCPLISIDTSTTSTLMLKSSRVLSQIVRSWTRRKPMESMTLLGVMVVIFSRL